MTKPSAASPIEPGAGIPQATGGEKPKAAARTVRGVLRGLGAIAAAVGIFYGTSATLGYYLGRWRSPDFARSDNVQRIIERLHSARLVTKATATAPAVVELTLRGGERVYRYRSDTDRVESEYVLPGQLPRAWETSRRPEGGEKVVLAGASVVTAGAGKVALLVDDLPAGRTKSIGAGLAAAALVAGAGVAWGYHYGYSEEIPFEAPELRQALADPERWRPYAKAALQPAPETKGPRAPLATRR